MHIGHYISGSAHAGVLSWILVGAWFTPPEPAPLKTVNVSVISTSEYAALTRADASPIAQTSAVKITQSNSVIEAAPSVPRIEKSNLTRFHASNMKEVRSSESQPVVPNLTTILSPETAEDLPSLASPTESSFTLLRVPENFEKPRQLERTTPAAIATPPPENKMADQSQKIATPFNLADPSKNVVELKENELSQTNGSVDTVYIRPELEIKFPKVPQVPLQENKQTDKPSFSTDPPEALNDEIESYAASLAPLKSLRPQARPEKIEVRGFIVNERSDLYEKEAIATALTSALATDEQSPVSELTGKQKLTVRTAVKNAVRPYWNLIPNSPASNVSVVLQIEFSKSGKVKEESIKLISSKGGDEKATKTAVRAAKTAVKRASSRGAFTLPEETFDGWKILVFEFDPKEMRKR